MATYEGSNGSVKVDVDASGSSVAVAEVRSWSIDIAREAVEATSMGDGSRIYKKGLQGYSGSMDIVYDDTSEAVVSVALDPSSDQTISIELFPDASVTGTKFEGDIIVTSYSVTAAFDGLVEASVSFQGTGALATTKFGQ